MKGQRERRGGGFALVLTVVLLALLVLALYALSALVRVSGEATVVTGYQMEARQQALLGLAQAQGALQKLAGPDDRVTAMGGIAGEAGGSQRRHWCGVWDEGGAFLGWLVSGAGNGRAPSLDSSSVVQLVERNSVGVKPATASAYEDEEYVDAGKIAVSAPTANGGARVTGSYAYWIGDEGVKVSAWARDEELPAGGWRIRVASTPLNIARLGAAFQQFDRGNASKVLMYEQATNLFHAAGNRVTKTNLHDAFHHVTRTHRSVSGGGVMVSGRVNLNTTSAVVWRSLIESYEAAPGATPFGSAAKRTRAVNTLAGDIGGSAAGKFAGAPFGSVTAFLGSELLKSAVEGTSGITAEEFAAVMEPMLTVRSDTFRVRAYGEAVNRLDAGHVEAVAYCEAIVQRTTLAMPDGSGRRFEVTYFRWLGPDDI